MITHWKWDKVFKNGPSKICGRQHLKNFTWSILEYFFLNESNKLTDLSLISCFSWQLKGELRAAINACLTRYLSVFPILMIQRPISFLHFLLVSAIALGVSFIINVFVVSVFAQVGKCVITYFEINKLVN